MNSAGGRRGAVAGVSCSHAGTEHNNKARAIKKYFMQPPDQIRPRSGGLRFDVPTNIYMHLESALEWNRWQIEVFFKQIKQTLQLADFLGHSFGVCVVHDDQAIAALLHDCVEDRGVRPEEIRERFGKKVADIVVACSDSLEKDPHKKAEWRVRKQAYLEHLKTAPPPVLLVSAADKLHNARSILKDFREIGDAVWERFKGGKDGSLRYYRSLVEIFQARGEHRPLVDEFARTVAELQRLSAGG